MRLFAQNRDGNVAMTFALLTPVLCLAAGIAIDFQARLAQKSALQDAADTLALRGARELLLDSATGSTIEALLAATATRQFGPVLGRFDMAPAVDTTNSQVRVEIAQPSRQSFFLSQFIPHEDPIIVDATAQAQGMTNVCVIALEETGGDAIYAGTQAQLDAGKCAILSNSRSSSGVNVTNLAKVTAGMICSAGGALGGTLNFNPMPILDCPQYADPLAERMPPTAVTCDFVDTVFAAASGSTSGGSTGSTGSTGGGGAPKGGGGAPTTSGQLSQTTTITATTGPLPVATVNGATQGTLTGYQRFDMTPGVYCGGVRIEGSADVHAAPGIYIIKDGLLQVDGGARLYGENVGFYFDGDKAMFNFKRNSIVYLTAPKTGLMAGLLFWESASAPDGRKHNILSDNARELLGTIYLPKGTLNIDTMMPIADASAYTAIVASHLSLDGTPQLVLNTNYGATDIPVPAGVGPTGGAVYLRE